MDRSAYALHASVEARHWWFRARRRVVEAVLARVLVPSGNTLIELGSGTGGNLAMLSGFGQIWAVEPDAEARALAALAAPWAQQRASLAELPEGSRFDAALLLDVLEHLDDPAGDLRRLARLLAPGAPVLVTVPAHPLLFGEHDRYLHHRRRYTRRLLRTHLETAGLVVERITPINAVSLAPAAVARLAEAALAHLAQPGKRGGAAARGMGVPPAPLNRALEAVFAAERLLLPHGNVPFGLSLLALARAPRPADAGHPEGGPGGTP
jgi:SAM-dependent methyltransferase